MFPKLADGRRLVGFVLIWFDLIGDCLCFVYFVSSLDYISLVNLAHTVL